MPKGSGPVHRGVKSASRGTEATGLLPEARAGTAHATPLRLLRPNREIDANEVLLTVRINV
jgi:hypothetical protein